MGLCSVTNWKIALVLNLEYEPGGRNTEDWSAMREDMLSWPCRCSQQTCLFSCPMNLTNVWNLLLAEGLKLWIFQIQLYKQSAMRQ
ncbi:hypothetical protein CIPAW_11G129500 [Carya illinoinensis]|uniref:Uncharacterized protein n=1 Tax=Carya illinoinensis TaxID=32201 RepID=A0A8T1P355_CARIL|nr:hypothetical protein CIPAW_11G129500 [Carya illinoinensis]